MLALRAWIYYILIIYWRGSAMRYFFYSNLGVSSLNMNPNFFSPHHRKPKLHKRNHLFSTPKDVLLIFSFTFLSFYSFLDNSITLSSEQTRILSIVDILSCRRDVMPYFYTSLYMCF